MLAALMYVLVIFAGTVKPNCYLCTLLLTAMFLWLQEMADVTDKAGHKTQAKKALMFPQTQLNVSTTVHSSLQKVVLLMDSTCCHRWHIAFSIVCKRLSRLCHHLLR